MSLYWYISFEFMASRYILYVIDLSSIYPFSEYTVLTPSDTNKITHYCYPTIHKQQCKKKKEHTNNTNKNPDSENSLKISTDSFDSQVVSHRNLQDKWLYFTIIKNSFCIVVPPTWFMIKSIRFILLFIAFILFN